MDSKIFTVSELNNTLKRYIEKETDFKNMFIQGEISNITYQASGHLYFTLKDKKASMKFAIFGYSQKGVPRDLKVGEQVKVRGSANFYPLNGTLQILADKLDRMNSLGVLFEKLEKLKKYYFEKGYFDESNKKKLPYLPLNIGVVTAKTGAAIRDIIDTVHKRYSNVNIYLYPSKVQGEGASLEIAKGIKTLNQLNDEKRITLDALIVGRGGGSIEDLWAFNEEAVVEAIFDSKLPVISAVGHEIDNLLSDLVADKRAATPTQAAEILIPKKTDFLNELNNLNDKLNKILENKISIYKKEMKHLKNSYYIKNIDVIINDKRMTLVNFENTLTKNLTHKINIEKNNFKSLETRIKRHDIKNTICTHKLELDKTKDNINKIMNIKLKKLEEKLEVSKSRISIKKIQKEKENLEKDLFSLKKDVNKIIIEKFKDKKNKLYNLKLKVLKYSSEDILKQGYTITMLNGKIVKKASELKKGDIIKTRFIDNNIKSEVK